MVRNSFDDDGDDAIEDGDHLDDLFSLEVWLQFGKEQDVLLQGLQFLGRGILAEIDLGPQLSVDLDGIGDRLGADLVLVIGRSRGEVEKAGPAKKGVAFLGKMRADWSQELA